MESSKKIIYLVEDSLIISNILKKTMELEENVCVTTFTNCEDVIHATKFKKPHLVITDYYLEASVDQRFNGAYLLGELRKLDPRLPVILMTGMAEEDRKTVFLYHTFNAVLDKNDEDIISKTNEVIKHWLPMNYNSF